MSSKILKSLLLISTISVNFFSYADEVSLSNPNTNDGSIEFFIPLKTSTSGTLGEQNNNVCTTGVGTCSDIVGINHAVHNSDGWLNLELFFEVPANSNVNSLQVTFKDLDLNDYRISNSLFWETAEFYYGDYSKNQDGILDFSSASSFATLARIYDGSDSKYNNTNNKTVSYSFDISALSIPSGVFSIGLQLTANLEKIKSWNTTFGNTKESLTASINYKDKGNVTPVPEPSTLLLFALALFGFAIPRFKQG